MEKEIVLTRSIGYEYPSKKIFNFADVKVEVTENTIYVRPNKSYPSSFSSYSCRELFINSLSDNLILNRDIYIIACAPLNNGILSLENISEAATEAVDFIRNTENFYNSESEFYPLVEQNSYGMKSFLLLIKIGDLWGTSPVTLSLFLLMLRFLTSVFLTVNRLKDLNLPKPKVIEDLSDFCDYVSKKDIREKVNSVLCMSDFNFVNDTILVWRPLLDSLDYLFEANKEDLFSSSTYVAYEVGSNGISKFCRNKHFFKIKELEKRRYEFFERYGICKDGYKMILSKGEEEVHG